MQDCVKEVRDLESSYEDINALIELTEEEEDREMIKEIQREIAKFEKEFEDLCCIVCIQDMHSQKDFR